MNRLRGWLAEDGWWRKEDWGIKVKFTAQAENIFLGSDDHAELQLQDAVQYVTHVESTQNSKFGIEVLFDALDLSKPSLSESINVDLNSANAVGLEKAIKSGHLRSLKHLRFHNDTGHGLFTLANDIGDEAAKSLGVAIRSGELKNLVELRLNDIRLTDEGLVARVDSFQEGVGILVPNLSSLDIGWNSFTEVGLRSLSKAVTSGKLPNLSCVNISGHSFKLNEGAKSIGLAIRSCNIKNLAIGISKEGLITVVDSFQESVTSLLRNLSSGKLLNLIYLNISGNNIASYGAKPLGLAIRSGELNNLAELSLNNIGLTDEGLIALTDSFQEAVASLLPNLSSLDIGLNSFTAVGLLSLAEALSSGKLPNLSSLDISGNDFIGNEGAKIIGLAIRSGNLKKLAVGISNEGLIAVVHSFQKGMASVLRNLSSGKLSNLIYLDIAGNNIGSHGAKSLGLAMQSGELKNLAELKLNQTGLTDEGLIALTDSFQEGVASLLPNLSSLDIGLNSFTAVGLLSLAEALSSGKLPSLISLDISGNAFIRNEGAKIIGLAIRSGNLKNLAVGISNEGLIAVVHSFQKGVASVLRNLSSGKISNLIYLDISGNHIGSHGAKSLGLAMQSGELKNLADLKLNQTGLTDEGLIALTDFFQDGLASLLPNLSSLDLSFNSFTEVGLLSLGEALKSSQLNSLNVLDIQHSIDPSKENARALVSAFLTNNCLTVDVKFEWYKFPELDRRREQLIERNHRHKDILAGLVTLPKVHATFGKVYLCGNPEVGKTTLRRTLQRSFWKSLLGEKATCGEANKRH